MSLLPFEFEKFSLNKFWEKTPNSLKYILIFALLIIVIYFIGIKRAYSNKTNELTNLVENVEVTYQLIDNFEEFKRTQEIYNEELLTYINNLHVLVQELNSINNQKLDMLLSLDNKNRAAILEKMLILNESFNKLSKVYQEIPNKSTINKETPNYESNYLKYKNKNK